MIVFILQRLTGFVGRAGTLAGFGNRRVEDTFAYRAAEIHRVRGFGKELFKPGLTGEVTGKAILQVGIVVPQIQVNESFPRELA